MNESTSSIYIFRNYIFLWMFVLIMATIRTTLIMSLFQLQKEFLQTLFCWRVATTLSSFIFFARTVSHRPSIFSCLVVHVYATAHLTNWVFGYCLGGLANRVGPRRKNIPFSVVEDMSSRRGGTTIRGRLVSRQKTAVFRPR